MKRHRTVLYLLSGILTGTSIWAQNPAAHGPSYSHDIRPILEARCVVCHNHAVVDKPAVSGGLALDTYEAVLRGVAGKSPKPIFAAGKGSASDLIKRLTATSPTKMMPRGGPALPPDQIALFRRWIDAGAPPGAAVVAGASVKAYDADAAPMPRQPRQDDVRFDTKVKLPADMLPKGAPKEAFLHLAARIGPLAPASAIAFSPSGKLLAVGQYRAVVLWDTVAGRPVSLLTHLAGTVQSVAFRPDGIQLAVAGGAPGCPGEAQVYSAVDLKPAGPPLKGHDDVVNSIAWSVDGTRLATGSQDKTARLWDWPSGKELRMFRDHADAVTCVCFAPDGKSLYTASQDHNVRRFNMATGEVMRTFSGHAEEVTALAVSPNGRDLVSAGSEPRLRWWNLDNGDTSRNNDGHEGPVNAIVFSKDGKVIASASGDRTVRIWNGENGGQERALEGSPDWVYAASLSPDAKLAAGACADGVVRIWEVGTGRMRLSAAAWPMDGPVGKTDWLTATPEGYYDGSVPWAALVKPADTAPAAAAARLADVVKSLRQPKSVAAAWQDGALDAASVPATTAPAGKASTGGKK